MDQLVPIERIESKILLIRSQKVMLDRDLAELYGVKPIRLREQVKRNAKRFPGDFMFQLNDQEKNELIAICDRFKTMKHSPVNPYVFTEQGVAMLSSVLNSERAILVNIQIIRAFTMLRRILASHEEIRRKIEAMERKYDVHLEEHDTQFKAVFTVIQSLVSPPVEKQKKIEFVRRD